jgi:hypothetical protein
MRLTLSDRFANLPWGLKAMLVAMVLVCLVGFNLSSLYHTRQLRDVESVTSTEEVIYVPDVRLMRLMTLGYDQAAADIIWIRTLEYFARHFRSDRKYRWLEHFVDQIIHLDPDFRKVYHWAGTNALYGRRFVNENVWSSNHFYEKALEHDPDDHEAAYRLGLNYYVELRGKDEQTRRAYREKGLAYLERAANTPGAPTRTRNLVASISSRLGKKQLALQYLIDMYIQTDDAKQKLGLKTRIDALHAEGDRRDLAQEADLFEARWKTNFPYLTPGLYSVIGEPSRATHHDVDWRSLLPNVTVTEATQADTKP